MVCPNMTTITTSSTHQKLKSIFFQFQGAAISINNESYLMEQDESYTTTSKDDVHELIGC